MANFSFAGHRRALGKATRRALRLSHLALIAEELARAVWPAFSILCFTLAAALFGLFAGLDALQHRIAVLTALGLFCAALGWAAYRFRMPDRAAAARRLDADHPTHPIATLDDHLAGGRDDRTSQSLWIEHQRRAEKAAAELRARAPEPRLARYDRWALRLFAPTLLIGGLIGNGGDWTDRLGTLVAPLPPGAEGAAAGQAAREPVAEAWAIPPAYTGLETLYLNRAAGAGSEVRVPAGSELVLRVTDLNGKPELTAPGLTGFEGFSDFGGALAEARGVLTASGPVEISGNGDVLARWEVTVVPDAPPEIAMSDPPGSTLAGALEVHFTARDDYGVDTAWAEIVPMGGLVPGKGIVSEPVVFALPLPIAGRALEVSDSAIRDLGEHPWAGAWVELRLYAEDGAGQQAVAGPVTMRLPGRDFQNTLARALVEQRRELALDTEQGAQVLDVLQAVTRLPEEVFGDNTGAFLGVRTAIRRLADGVVSDRVSRIAPDVAEFLWQAALSLENGDLASALERLRSAEEKLRQALESGSDQDIREAMQELRAAMQEYLAEMMRQAMERGLDQQGQQQPQQGQGDDRNTLSQQDLEDMLKEMERRAEAGLRDQARDMLNELSRMLENLQAGQPRQGPGQQSLQQLQEMIQRQRDLSDRTFDALRQQRREGQQPGGQQGDGRQQQQGGQNGQQGEGRQPGESGAFGGLSMEQEALRRALEELAKRIPGDNPDIDNALEGAGKAMGEATENLDNRLPDDAVEDQIEALDRLAEGAEALAEAIRNGQGNTAAEGRSRGEGRARDHDLDPFDRPAGAYGAIDGRDTKVPDRSVLDRAREVLEELRRRAAEPQRPRLELDYLDRLMDQF